MKKFYKIHGSNGGTFIFSSASLADWKKSLEFYRSVTFFARCKKQLLTLAYPILKPNYDSSQFLYGELKSSDSAMISPTGDKVIIHHHGAGYEKLAFGRSLSGVRVELQIYKLLNEKNPAGFAFSETRELKSKSRECRFYMKYAGESFSEDVPELRALLMPLKEFFLLPGIKKMRWQDLWNTLPDDLQYLIFAEDRIGETPVGLVHRDFKPWNVKSGRKPLFFDFESASFTGCPLEDFFNYTVDPMLRFSTPEKVWKKIQTDRILAETLLNELGIAEKEFSRYWRWYLLERISFWRNQEQTEISNRFQNLFEKSAV